MEPTETWGDELISTVWAVWGHHKIPEITHSTIDGTAIVRASGTVQVGRLLETVFWSVLFTVGKLRHGARKIGGRNGHDWLAATLDAKKADLIPAATGMHRGKARTVLSDSVYSSCSQVGIGLVGFRGLQDRINRGNSETSE